MASSAEIVQHDSAAALAARYSIVRELTLELCARLTPEDTVVQSMPDVSPTKWHLAHVTWFFEHFVLQSYVDDYRLFDEQFDFLFNSYYYTAGPMHARPKRGLLTRPTLDEVIQYRAYVDEAMQRFIDARGSEPELTFLITLGLNHEQQHQELLLTDIKHVLSCNPMQPALAADLPLPPGGDAQALRYSDGVTGIQKIGVANAAFHFDNETPRHDALLHPHRVADRLVTNAEFREFVNDGGYRESSHWLSDGWATVNQEEWRKPLYWNDELQSEFTLAGVRDIDENAPVSHISYYEADAFARWAGARLPTEFEWEVAASTEAIDGNLLESGFWHPCGSTKHKQFYGDVWEWTSSPYMPYPGFKTLDGSLGEYNGKFMCNQMTVRGGSCVTSHDHIRATYRSFFYPAQRWQFLGFRLASDS